MSKRKTQEEFLSEVRSKNTYNLDLTKFVYTNNHTKSTVKCLDCGYEWETSPQVLLRNHGCPKCAIEYKARKLSDSVEEFIEKAKKVHGDLYEYDRVHETFKNDITPVSILCKTHGYFMQRPDAHKMGKGCPKCHGGVSYSKEEFIAKVSEKNEYFNTIDLSGFEYENAFSKGKCKCKVCGNEWYSIAYSLTNMNVRCPVCASKSRVLKRTDTLDDFKDKFYKKFPDSKYDFSESVYKNALTYFTVICPTHGKFITKPNWMLGGHGCALCNESILEKTLSGVLVSENITYIRQYRDKDKFGRLSLDFYLPDYNVAIECQGEQHYKSVGHFGGDEKFEKTKERDSRKKRLCEENNVKLLYFTDEKLMDKVPEEYKSITYCDKNELLKEIKT